MNDIENSQLQEVRKRMDKLESGQDEILQLLRGPLEDPTKGLIATVKRVEADVASLRNELSIVASMSHQAPCPFLSGAETMLGDHLKELEEQKAEEKEKRNKREQRTWDVLKPLLVQLFGAILGGSIITWILRLFS